ncbi:MAG TPA: hypothetical protein VFZ53_29280 [Polyangiaceae bacterium]
MRHVLSSAALLFPFVVSSAVACIEVGHEAETGCLVDQSAPGCRAAGRGGSTSGGSSGGGTSGTSARGGSAGAGGTSTAGSPSTGGAAGANEGGEGGA